MLTVRPAVEIRPCGIHNNHTTLLKSKQDVWKNSPSCVAKNSVLQNKKGYRGHLFIDLLFLIARVPNWIGTNLVQLQNTYEVSP